MVYYRWVFAVTWSNIVLNLVYHKEYYVQLSTPHSVLCSVLPVANMKSNMVHTNIVLEQEHGTQYMVLEN